MKKIKILLIDDDFFIRQIIKVLLNKFADTETSLEFFSSYDGVEGLGFMYVTNPDIVILDATLPKYSGREVVDFLISNKHFADKNVIVLSSKDKKVGVLPENYIVLEKEANNFTKDLFKTFTYLITGELKKKEISKSVFSSQIIKFAHFSDTLFYKITSGNLLMKLVNFPAWFVVETLTAFIYTVYSFFVKKIKDANIKQEKRDLLLFRVKSYPAVALVVLPLVFLGFQLFLYAVGGIAISNIRVQSIFANSGTEYSLDLTKSTFDSSKIELNGGLTLMSFTQQVPSPVSYATDIQPESITNYYSDNPSAILEDKIEFSQLLGIAPNFNITNNNGSSYNNEAEDIQQILTESSLLDSNGLTFQLSPDKQNWYYFDADKWKKTELEFETSNDVLVVNKNINLFERDVSFDTTNFVGTLYLKVFFASNSNYKVTLSKLRVLRVLDVLEVTTLSLPPQDTPSEEIPNETPISSPVSFPDEITPTPKVTPLPLDVNVDLVVPTLFQATFENGNKLLYGKILGDLPASGEISVEGYYTNDTNTTIPARDLGEFIGSAKPVLNANGELIFLIVAPSREGGYVTTRLVRDLNGEKTYSTLSKPIENSTYTVDNTGDQSDSDTGDGLCLTGSSTCTLRAAIEQANAHGGSDTIFFNINTSSSGFRTYSLPNSANSGSTSDGQSYWTIRPGSDLPAITGPTIIDGSSQTTNQGNYNNQGPEIEIKGNGVIAIGLEFTLTSDGSTVAYIGVNNFADQNMYVNQSDTFVLTSSHIGIDVRANAATAANYALKVDSSNNLTIGNNLATGNYFANSKSTGHNVSVGCGSVSGTKVVTFKGNKVGVNYAATSKVGSALINTQFVGDCNATIGGSTTNDSNVFGGANFAGLNIDSDGLETNSDYKVYNNFFGTNSSGTVNLSNFLDISLQDWLGGSFANSIKIGNSSGRGNLFRYSNYGIAIDHPRPINISYNTFGNIGNNAITVGNQYTNNASAYSVVSITNNQIGQSSSDPYYSLNITGSGEHGIVLNKASAVIKGNIISTNGKYGIISRSYAPGEDISSGGGNSSSSVPVIGGSSALTGSLCTNEANCIKSNVWGGVYSIDGVAFNEATIYSDNNWTGGNGNGISYEQAWLGLAEIISGTVRRTDLANGSQITNFSVNQRVKSNENPFSILSSASNLLVDCSVGMSCPLSGSTSGIAGKTMVYAPSGSSSDLFSKAQNWFNVSEYVINNAGVKTTYGTFNSSFTYDGNSTTNPLSSYPGKGEPWSDSGTADRDLATANFGRFQIGETEITDGNPSYDGVNYTIIVDTTTDEDNVSLVGVDDGGGVYSGGGSSGVDGPANGKTSLREAIIVANKHPGLDRIHFSIPTSDAGYRDYDTPNTSSSGDSTDGDDYWTIRPAAPLPDIISGVTIDGTTQATNQSDTNTNGPEIEVSGINAGNMANHPIYSGSSKGLLFFNSVGTGSTSTVKGLVINNAQAGQGIATFNPHNLIIQSNYIGTDVKGISAKPNTNGAKTTSWAGFGIFIYTYAPSGNITIGGPSPSDGNLISGNSSTGINVITDNGSFGSFVVQNNYVGTNKTGTAAIANMYGGIALGHQGTGASGNYTITSNLISGNAQSGISLYRVKDVLVQSNIIGLNATQTGTVGNNRGIDWRNDETTVARNNVVIDNNVIAGHTTHYGIFTIFAGGTTTGGQITNNIIGTNAAKSTSYPNLLGINLGNWSTGPANINVDVDNNTIWNSSGNSGIFIQLSSATSALNITRNDIRNNVGGIQIYGQVATIKGNLIQSNTRYGIRVTNSDLNYSRTNSASQVISKPIIGGQSALTGSLCGGLEKNCINTNTWGGIYSIDAVPSNESTIWPDNNFTGGNGSGGANNIEQAWNGLFELDSAIARRTDLANGTFTLNFPAGTRVKTGDDPATIVTSGTNLLVTCLNASDCPASAGNSSGTASSTEMIVPAGSTASILSNANSWYKITQYIYNGSGTLQNYQNFTYNQSHLTSKNFSFDGQSTTDSISGTGSSHVSNSITYTDRGEPWTDKPTATRNIATSDLGRFQIMEVDVVDANPVLNSGVYEITVERTSDEDNVSTSGVDDGGGAYTGGGGTGPSGIADGKTSLREAILVGNNLTSGATIKFNIPTSDPNYNTGAFPNAFRIQPTSTYTVQKPLNIDGTTQTIFTGDTNVAINDTTTGPEIILDLSLNSTSYGMDVNSSPTIKGLGFYNSATSNRVLNVTVNDLVVTNNDFVGNNQGGIRFNVVSGNYTVSNNIFRSNAGNEPISMFGASPLGGSITSNTFKDNATTSISIEGSPTTDITLSSNRFISNVGYGVSVSSGVGSSGMRYIINNNYFQDNVIGGIYVENSNNYNTTITNNKFLGASLNTPINLLGGTEDFYGATVNDTDDLDNGPNRLMNSPTISSVIYIGGGQYTIAGNLNNKVSGEGEFSIEVCESDDHISGHGGCIRTLATVQHIAQASDGNSPWTSTVTIPGDDGTQNRKFSALATNNLGATSEFSSKFTQGRNVIQDYPITLVSPIGGAIVRTSTPSLIWNANGDPDIASYEVYFNGTLIATVPAGQTSYTLPTPQLDGAYTWQVKDKRVNSTYGGVSTVENFTIDTTIVITLISPIGGVNISNPLPTLTWNPTTDPLIQTYQVYLDGNLITTVPSSQHAYTLVSALEVGLHNWQIKGLRSANIASGQSVVETFNRTPSNSQDIILIGPIGGVEITDATPTLSWNPTSNPDVASYDVYLDGNLIGTIPISQTSLTTSPISLGNHTWQVKGKKADNTVITLSVVENFNEVYRIYATTPADQSSISTLRPVFSWTDTHNATISYFRIYLNGNLLKQLAGYTYTTENEIPEGNYQWYVEAYDSSDQLVGTSNTNSFIIKQVFILNVDSEVSASSELNSVNIIWNLSPANPPGGSTYDITILDNNGVVILQINDLPNIQVSYQLTDEQLALLLPGTNYTVSVTLVNSQGTVIAQGSTIVSYTLQINLISNTLESIGLNSPGAQSTATTLVPIALVGLSTIVTSSITALNVVGVLFGILIPRKRRYWGIVFDAETNKPLAFTTIRVINTKDNKVYQTVSDLEGRYGINVERAGSYTITALQSNYSSFKKEIIVLNPEREVIEDIALTKLSDAASNLRLFIVRNKGKFITGLNSLLLVLTILGFIYTLFVTITSPIVINFVILSLYIIIFFLNSVILLRTNFAQLKGRVISKSTGLGVEGVVVRLFTQDSRSVTVAMTDENGLMRLNIEPGTYIAKASKSGFILDSQEGQEITRVVVRKDGYLEKDIVMKQISMSLDAFLDIEKLDTPFGN